MQLVEEHRRWVEANGYDIRGRIYYSEQGVNSQYGGRTEEATAYVKWLASQPMFQVGGLHDSMGCMLASHGKCHHICSTATMRCKEWCESISK